MTDPGDGGDSDDPGDSPPPDLGPITLGTAVITRAGIPAIDSQPTLTGKAVRVSSIIDGEVSLPYGDYGANTGPIDVLTLSRAGAVTTHLAATPTERIERYRVLNTGVWATSIDPRGSGAGFLITNVGGWRTTPLAVDGLPVVEHGFDVAQEPNGDLYVVVTHTPDTAAVWRSTDDAVTWAEVFAHASGLPDGYNRFYSLRRTTGGDLVVTRTNSGGSGYFVRAGESWVATSSVTFADERRVRVTDGVLWHHTRGYIGTLPDPAIAWTAALDPDDGAIWLADGESVWLLPPPD